MRTADDPMATNTAGPKLRFFANIVLAPGPRINWPIIKKSNKIIAIELIISLFSDAYDAKDSPFSIPFSPIINPGVTIIRDNIHANGLCFMSPLEFSSSTKKPTESLIVDNELFLFSKPSDPDSSPTPVGL